MSARGPSRDVRRRAWTVMRALQEQGRRFTAASVADEIRAPLPRIASLMRLGLMHGAVLAVPDAACHPGSGDEAGTFAIMPLRLAADAPPLPPRPTPARRGAARVACERVSNRERLWREIQKTREPFGTRAIVAAAGVDRQHVHELLSAMLTARFVELVSLGAGARGRRLYRLLERGGARPPVRERDGTIRDPNDGRRWSPTGEPLPRGEADPPPHPERAWLAMRAISGTFTLSDIALLAEVSANVVQDLLATLERIAYVVRVERHSGPSPNKFRLIVRSGPRVPRRCDGGWIDPNDGRRWDLSGAELPPVKRWRRS